jgi:hypothetical protein
MEWPVPQSLRMLVEDAQMLEDRTTVYPHRNRFSELEPFHLAGDQNRQRRQIVDERLRRQFATVTCFQLQLRKR